MDNTNFKKLTVGELREIIAAHRQWVANRNNGRRLDLNGYDLSGLNLDYADLRYAILVGCNLTNISLFQARLADANLSDSNLTNACLRLADLSSACLNRTVLTCTDLHGAVLREAYLIGATIDSSTIFDSSNISFAMFDKKDTAQIARLDFGGWPITVRSDETIIGCQRHRNTDWLSWTADSPELIAMHTRASDWWALYGDAVKSVIKAVMGVVKHNQ